MVKVVLAYNVSLEKFFSACGASHFAQNLKLDKDGSKTFGGLEVCVCLDSNWLPPSVREETVRSAGAKRGGHRGRGPNCGGQRPPPARIKQSMAKDTVKAMRACPRPTLCLKGGAAAAA